MKIKKATYRREHLPLKRPYTIAYEQVDAVENLFVRIQTEDGHVGLGAASPAEDVTGETIQICEEALKTGLDPILVGEDVRHCKTLLRKLGQAMAGAPAARAAVDIALHDLLGNLVGLPLVDLLGRVHDALPTSITIGIMPVAETLDEAEEYIGREFTILKVKTGLSIAEDVERLVKLRERFGLKIGIRVDANQGYTLADYQRFVQETRSLNIEFVEQPLKASDLDGMRGLPEPVRNQTAADESLLEPASALACLEPPRPFGIFNIKLMKCGGIAPGLEIANMARHSGTHLMWGCMDESVVSITGALHAAMAAPATRYLDLDGSFDLARDPIQGGFILEKGRLRPNDRPGLGVVLKRGTD